MEQTTKHVFGRVILEYTKIWDSGGAFVITLPVGYQIKGSFKYKGHATLDINEPQFAIYSYYWNDLKAAIDHIMIAGSNLKWSREQRELGLDWGWPGETAKPEDLSAQGQTP